MTANPLSLLVKLLMQRTRSRRNKNLAGDTIVAPPLNYVALVGCIAVPRHVKFNRLFEMTIWSISLKTWPANRGTRRMHKACQNAKTFLVSSYKASAYKFDAPIRIRPVPHSLHYPSLSLHPWILWILQIPFMAPAIAGASQSRFREALSRPLCLFVIVQTVEHPVVLCKSSSHRTFHFSLLMPLQDLLSTCAPQART